MKLILVICLFFIRVHGDFTAKNCYESTNDDDMCLYMSSFNKVYAHKDEYLERKKSVTQKMHHLQKSSPLTKYALNAISDRTFHPNTKLKSKSPVVGTHVKRLNSYSLPLTLDLRDKLPSIKDQGNCGSCYIFAGVAVLEYYAGVSISEQKIMDCSSSENGPSYGCGGGWPENVFEYAKKAPVVLEKTQPYQEQNNPCNQTCSGSVVQVKRYGSLDMEKDPDSELRIPYILNQYGPVVVAIDVGTTELLMSYQEGVFPGIACGKEVDHAVTIVGYTEDYWIVRNSWSEEWGDNGYFYLERGVNACGVAETISYISSVKNSLQI